MKPFISIITPTRDRPEFFSNIQRNFFRQNYDLSRMELIIGDDSDKSNELLIQKHKNINYIFLEKMSIGKKRNILCERSKGDIIIFMDDDDYYPPNKVSHVVDKLWNSKYLVSGSSEMYVYYICYDKIFKFGPYRTEGLSSINHATCGTLSFKKEYFKNNKFPDKNSAEEKIFLNNYKTKVLQLDSLKSILCISHLDNTVDKHKHLKSGIKTNLKLEDIIFNKIDIEFYRKLIGIQSGGEFEKIDIKI